MLLPQRNVGLRQPNFLSAAVLRHAPEAGAQITGGEHDRLVTPAGPAQSPFHLAQ